MAHSLRPFNIPQHILDVVKHLDENHIPHKQYEWIRKRVYAHTALATRNLVLLVVGPGRAGKSRIGEFLLGISKNMSTIRAGMPTTGNPLTIMKYLNSRLLNETKHPVYQNLYAVDTPGKSLRVNNSDDALRQALESAIAARKVQNIIVDEAHHALNAKTIFAAQNNLDSLKTLGNESKATVILLGGYKFLEEGLISSHLTGRMRILHFRRYMSENPEDVDAFDEGLNALSELLPLRKGHSLLDFSPALMDGSIGAFGSVVTWTGLALGEMVAQGSQFLTKSHYEATRYGAQVECALEDALMGESRLELLEFDSEGCLVKGPEADAKESPQAPKKKRRSFRRNPKRLPVGRR